MLQAARHSVVAVMSKMLWCSTHPSGSTREYPAFAFRSLSCTMVSVSKDAEKFRNSVYIKHRIRADTHSRVSASDLRIGFDSQLPQNSLQDQEAKTPGPESNSENRAPRKGTQ